MYVGSAAALWKEASQVLQGQGRRSEKGARPDDSDIFLKMEIAMPYPFHDASKQDLVE